MLGCLLGDICGQLHSQEAAAQQGESSSWQELHGTKAALKMAVWTLLVGQPHVETLPEAPGAEPWALRPSDAGAQQRQCLYWGQVPASGSQHRGRSSTAPCCGPSSGRDEGSARTTSSKE